MPNPVIRAIRQFPGATPVNLTRQMLSVTLDGRHSDGPYTPGYLGFDMPDWTLLSNQAGACVVMTDEGAWQVAAPWHAVAQYLHAASPCWIAGYLSYALAEQSLLGTDARPEESLPGVMIGGFSRVSIRKNDRTPPNPSEQMAPFTLTSAFRPAWSRTDYQHAFERIIDYIHAGDVYQINLTQCLEAGYQGDPRGAFDKLVAHFRAPFSGYIRYGKQAVLSFSPERFLHIRGRAVETRPIKGTRPRMRHPDADRQQAEALANSEKDRAENLMIVDLLRNDLGRYCQPGSIQVPELFGLEQYSNVHHLVSTVTGTLRKEVSPLVALAGCSPGGSITGAPKKRAMEIIRELEPVQRGVYCGSLFYMTPEGDLDSSIAIRTLTADGHRLRVWGGGGIVADSDCAAEYEESLTKIRHLINAFEAFRAS